MTNHTESEEYPYLTKDIVNEIFEAEVAYKNDDEKEICKQMVEALTSEEQKTAACTSYAYWYALAYFSDEDKPSKEVGIRMAMREARRQFVGAGSEEEAAMERLQACCKFREEYKLDLIRSCYQILPEGVSKMEGTPEEEELRAKYRGYIEEELKEKQQFFVRGQDSENRAVVIKMDRISPETDAEAYIITQIHMAERTLACTEFLSMGTQEKVVAVMDYANYYRANAPPLLTMKDAVTLLQANYPERLKTAIITEPPFWMRGIYNLLWPLMSEDTAEKVQMAYGEGKTETIRAIIAPDQALPFMMPEAELTSAFEAEKFLKVVPFHCVYDSKKKA